MLSRVGVAVRRGMDWMILFFVLLRTTRDYRQSERYRRSTLFTFHRYTYTHTIALSLLQSPLTVSWKLTLTQEI
jgi:hypothetical protein